MDYKLSNISIPAGLKAMYKVCKDIYPDQPNPLQVSAILKCWLGGPDPLDYISMYYNQGCIEPLIPPHWHYISFGFSDLHGDERVHKKNDSNDLSGFGFEITFRLRREPGEVSPPTWPAQLFQTLARYVFGGGGMLYAGDHISWHKPLDNSDSLIEHILLMEDPQLKTFLTPNGKITMLQIVGITREELEAAQKWSPRGVMNILKNIPNGACGGEWLITDMRRGMSMFELDPSCSEQVNEGIQKDGSDLSGVTGYCRWNEHKIEEEEKFLEADTDFNASDSTDKIVKFRNSLSPYGESEQPRELLQDINLEGVILTFDYEAGQLLLSALKGRIKHGRHFSFKSSIGKDIIMLVAENVGGKSVSLENPYVAKGRWLQVLIPDSFVENMITDLKCLDSDVEKLIVPRVFRWPEKNLSVVVEPGHEDDFFEPPPL